MRYGIFFGGVGLGTMLAGWILARELEPVVVGGSLLLGGGLLWSGATVLLVGVAYLGGWTRMLGKRSDGTLRWTSLLLLLPFYLATWTLWHLYRWLGRERCWDELRPGLYLGRRPLPGELPEEIDLLIDLTAEFPEARALRQLPGYRSLPALDGEMPSLDGVLALVEEIVAAEKRVYIHCAFGHGRTGVVAVALLLARHEADNWQEALALAQKHRAGIRLSASQRQGIKQLEALLIKKEALARKKG